MTGLLKVVARVSKVLMGLPEAQAVNRAAAAHNVVCMVNCMVSACCYTITDGPSSPQIRILALQPPVVEARTCILVFAP